MCGWGCESEAGPKYAYDIPIFVHIRFNFGCVFFFCYFSAHFLLAVQKCALDGHGLVGIYAAYRLHGVCVLLTFLFAIQHIETETDDLFSADGWKIKITDEQTVF